MNRNKYNTVKGWYQRTFNDWPSEGHKAKAKEHRPQQIGVPYQQQTGHHPKIFPAFPPPQQRQSYPQNEQNYVSQQASSANSYYPPVSSPLQAMGEVLPLHGTTNYDPLFQNHHYLPIYQHPQINSAASHSMYRRGDHQDLARGLNPQMSSGGYSSLPPHHSDGNVLQLSAGAIRPPHQQDHPRLHQNSYLQQASTQANEGGNPVGHDVLQNSIGPPSRDMNQTNLTDESQITFQQFLNSDSLNPDCRESMGPFGGGLNLAWDAQPLALQSNAAPKQSVLAYDDQRYHPSQTSHHQSAWQASAEPFTTGPSNDQIHALSSHHEHPSGALAGQNEPARASNKHHRSSLILSCPTPPPQYPLPEDPPKDFRVIHKGPNEPWHLLRMEGGSRVTVDPDSLPTDHPPKRVKGVGTKSHDSMAIHPEHLKAPRPVAPGNSASYVKQAAAARVPLSNRPVNSSNVSVRSSLRDSGYISILDYDKLNLTIVESMQSSFSTLNLTDAKCKTDYREADDGYVEVEITTKGRMRRSYIERMHSPVVGPDS